MAKLGFVGAGNVGASAAMFAAQMELGEIAIVDVAEGIPQGKGLDMYQTGPIAGFSRPVVGSNDFAVIEGSDVVIVTAGIARKPGMSREDLLKTNAQIVKSCAENIAKHAPRAVVVMVTNPLDVMTYLAFRATGFPKNRVIGQAGILDTARFRTFLAMELGVSPKDIQAMVLGGHGDTMVPIVDYATVAGIPVKKLIPADRLAQIVQRTRDGGAEIVALLKTGSAYYAPGAAAVEMAAAILRDEKRLLPCSCLLEGEYGIDGIYSGVPCILGKGGVERIVELELSSDDLAALQKSAQTYKEIAGSLGS